jgi:hypothetical protein
MPLPRDFLNSQITATQTQINEYQSLIAEFLDNGGVITYTLDDGQTRTVVTRMDLVRLEQQVDRLLNRLSVLCARRDGGGSTIGRPCW